MLILQLTFSRKEKKIKKMLMLQLTFLRRINDALKLSQIQIKLERFEIRTQFRNCWVF